MELFKHVERKPEELSTKILFKKVHFLNFTHTI